MFFFFNDTATTEIYTLSLHDALPICRGDRDHRLEEGMSGDIQQPAAHGEQSADRRLLSPAGLTVCPPRHGRRQKARSEEHTSELQSRSDLVCRLLLEKKNTTSTHTQS